jgi:hypothetical protein
VGLKDRPNVRGPRLVLALSVLYLGITLLMMQSMVNLAAINSAVYEGDASLIVWTLGWVNHAVLAGVSLFDANIFYPAASSLQYNEHLTGISLFTLPVYTLTGNPILGYNLVWILSFVLNALAMHALAWRHTRSHAAAITAALVFTFSFYKMLHAHGHLAHIWTWLIPLSLLLLERWIERPTMGRAATWAAAVILQALGSGYVAVMVVLVNGVALTWWLALVVRDRWWIRCRQLLIVSAAGAAIILPFALRYSVLDQPSISELRAYSADWEAYFTPPEVTWVGQWWLSHLGPGPGSIWGERTVFLGWLASTLAVVGAAALIARREWTRAGLAISIVLLGLFLSFGPHVENGVEGASLFRWLTALPGIAGFRAPARFALVALLGVAMLAAIGAQVLFSRPGRRSVVAAIVIPPLMLAEWFIPAMPGGRPVPVQIPEIYRTEVLRTARAIVSLPDYRGRADWYRGADYLLYSTIHWRPIVNGFGRAEPRDHGHIMSYMRAFPGPNNAGKMRELGIDYLVLNGARYPGGVDDLVRVALESGEYELIRQVGTDYVFHVRPSR